MIAWAIRRYRIWREYCRLVNEHMYSAGYGLSPGHVRTYQAMARERVPR